MILMVAIIYREDEPDFFALSVERLYTFVQKVVNIRIIFIIRKRQIEHRNAIEELMATQK